MKRLGLVIPLFLAAGPVHAQETGLAGVLLRFFSPTNPVVLRQSQPSHAAHFVSQQSAQQTLTQLNRGIASQLSTFPLGSSSSGFTYTFDPALGVYNRSTESFGPIFSERPLTAGKGKFSFGASFLRATYDRFEGQDLDGDLALYLTHEDTDGDGTTVGQLWFEGDIIRSDLFLDLESNTTVLFANYGVTDRLDIGVAVPFVDLTLDARIHASVERLSTQPDPFIVHIFPDGQDANDFSEGGSASGIGDLVFRAKLNLLNSPGGSLAGAVDLRLPTGREEDLLGSGATQTKVFLVGAGPAGRFSPRVSAGYTFSSGGSDFVGELPDEINYSAGFDVAVHPRVTLTADFLGRTLRDADRLVLTDREFRYHFRTDNTIRSVTRTTPTTETGDLTLLLGSAGLKINLVGRLLIAANVLFPLGDDGLQDKLTPVVGLDYTF